MNTLPSNDHLEMDTAREVANRVTMQQLQFALTRERMRIADELQPRLQPEMP